MIRITRNTTVRATYIASLLVFALLGSSRPSFSTGFLVSGLAI